MVAQGFNRSKYDVCVYLRKLDYGSFIYLLLYVEMLIAARDRFEVTKLKTLLGREFKMKDLGAAKKILGMEIYRDQKAGKLYLTQKSYLLKVLEHLICQVLKVRRFH